jgi:Ice-binding-like
MVPRLIVRLALSVPLAALLFVGCEHSGATGPVLGSLAFLTVTPNPQALAVGGTQTFTATGKDANGNAITVSPAPTWSVVTAASGIINAGSGAFTAGTLVGTYANTVQATSGGISGFATVSVGAGPLASITVIPDPTTMLTGTSQTFNAVGRDASLNLVTISPASLVWTVRKGTVATAGVVGASSGAYTAPAGTGTDTVRATSGSIFGQGRITVVAGAGVLATITVTPNPANLFTGDSVQFTATGYDPAGIVVALPALTWTVNPAVGGGTITSPAAMFHAGAVTGTFTNTVKATTGGATPVSGFATVIITVAPPPGPSLGTAQTYGIFAASAITCAGAPATINADVAEYAGTSITGFPPCTITGARHIADTVAFQAKADALKAYNALVALPCDFTIAGGLLITQTLAPGVYCSGSTIGLSGTLTLSGPANGRWVFQAGSAITTATAASVVMAGGGQASNVWWQVGSSATIGTGSQWQGNIVAFTDITLVGGGGTLCGRALALNGAVSMGTNSVIKLPPLAASTCP